MAAWSGQQNGEAPDDQERLATLAYPHLGVHVELPLQRDQVDAVGVGERCVITDLGGAEDRPALMTVTPRRRGSRIGG